MSESNKIELFKQTYNASYLKGLTKHKIEDVKQNVNPTLQRLIDNMDIPKTYMIQNIEGPKTFYKLKINKLGKSFYIFGAGHVDPTGGCLPDDSIPFPEYIRKLAQSTPSFFDLYIEQPMVRSSKPKNKEDKGHYDIILGNRSNAITNTIQSMLNNPFIDFNHYFEAYRKHSGMVVGGDKRVLSKMIEEFLDCFQSSTRGMNPICQLMRIHNVDARDSWLSETITDDYYLSISSLILGNAWKLYNNNNIDIQVDLIRRMGQRAIDTITSLFNYEKNQIDVDRVMTILLSNGYINKELGKVDDQMKQTITDFFKQKIVQMATDDIASNLNELIYCLKGLIPIQNIDNYFRLVSNLFLQITAHGMDMYCLARIFKTYNVQDSFQPQESKNIIIYTDAKHAVAYKEFLLSIGAEEIYQYTNPRGKSCVQISKWSPQVQSYIQDVREVISILESQSTIKLETGEITQKVYDNLDIVFDEVYGGLKMLLDVTMPSDQYLIDSLIQFQEQTLSLYDHVIKNEGIPEVKEPQQQGPSELNDFDWDDIPESDNYKEQ